MCSVLIPWGLAARAAEITASIAKDQRTQELVAALEELVANHLEKFSLTSSE
jgi:hypothetical protein